MGPICTLYSFQNVDVIPQIVSGGTCSELCNFTITIPSGETYWTNFSPIGIYTDPGIVQTTEVSPCDTYLAFSSVCGTQKFYILADSSTIYSTFVPESYYCFERVINCDTDNPIEYSGCFKVTFELSQPDPSYIGDIAFKMPVLYGGISSEDCLTECPCVETTPTPTPTQTQTPTVTPTITPTISVTPTNTITPSITPTQTPTPSTSRIQRFFNECEPITLFQMGVECVVLQPSTQDSNDGAASLQITGGTPPYTIYWDNGNISPAIGNLTVGSYGATVVDYYGDFTAKTVCILTGQTIAPTPTPTPTPSPIPSGPNFCGTLSVETPKTSYYSQQTYSVDSFVNGKPSWISGNGLYRVYWKTPPGLWEVSGSTTLPFTITNLNPTTPPINDDWVVNGASGTITVTEGSCGGPFELSPLKISNPDINLYVVKSDPTCGCKGSILANASGGNTPYQYSIDGGLTYKNFPIFDNLCQGVYTVTVKDYSGYTKSSQVTINKPSNPTTYVVNLLKTQTIITNNGIVNSVNNDVLLSVTPSLPNGASIIFDVVHTNNFRVSTTQEAANLVTNTELKINETTNPISFSSVTTGTTVNTIDGCQDNLVYFTGLSEVWEGVTVTSSDDFLIKTLTSVVKNFTTGCDIGSSDDTYYISNLKIIGCNCCSVQNITI